MAPREAFYEAVRQCKPTRCTGNTGNWKLPGRVWINPEKEDFEKKLAA